MLLKAASIPLIHPLQQVATELAPTAPRLNENHIANAKLYDDETVERVWTRSKGVDNTEAFRTHAQVPVEQLLFRLVPHNGAPRREELREYVAATQDDQQTTDTSTARIASTEHYQQFPRTRSLQEDCCSTRNDLSRVVKVQQEERILRERCARREDRIASDERDHRKLLIEAERYRLAAERSAAGIRSDIGRVSADIPQGTQRLA